MSYKKNNITRDDIIKYYIEEKHTISECAKFFNISPTTFKKYKREFSIFIDDKKSRCTNRRQLTDEEKYKRHEKIKNTLLERYGEDNPMKIKEFNDKAKDTNLKKYGYKNPNQNVNVLEKRKKTNLEKYGHECCLGNPEIQKKARDKCTQLYGDKYPLRSDKSKYKLLEKRKKTNLEKYGSEEITNSMYFKEKVRDNCLTKYGVTSPMESIYSQTIFKDINSATDYISKFEKKPTVLDITKDLSVSCSYVLHRVHLLNLEGLVELKPRQSSDEDEIIKFLQEIGVNKNEIRHGDRDILSGAELDIYLPAYKLAIEYNGTYWHSDIFKDKNYHQFKSVLCENAGISLVHIYQYEWKDPRKREIVKSILLNRLGKNSRSIHARKCDIKIVNSILAKEFLDTNHLDGYKSADIIYGLYLMGELVQIMTFKKHSNDKWEILQEASLLCTTVVGGASKLIYHFINNVNPKAITSVSDFNKFTGNIFIKNNMTYTRNIST